jgi:hypothetical protein
MRFIGVPEQDPESRFAASSRIVSGVGEKSMQAGKNLTHRIAPPLTVLMYGHQTESIVRNKGSFRVLRKPDQQNAGNAKNVFVLVAATELRHVSDFISTVNRRNQLRALLVSEDVEASSIPQMFERAHLRMIRNTIVHAGDTIPRRVLTAWAHKAQDQLVAKAAVSENRLFVLSCRLQQYEAAFDEMPALKRIPRSERAKFVVDENGSYLHWPGPDIHIDLDAIRVAKDPTARANTLVEKARHDSRFGAAIARLRVAKGLKQSDIKGISERQVRRIEKGEGTTSEALGLLAAAYRMNLDDYLKAVADKVSEAGIPTPTNTMAVS